MSCLHPSLTSRPRARPRVGERQAPSPDRPPPLPRVAKTLFGTFGERLSVPVSAGDWWFFHASSVELEAASRTLLVLDDCLPDSSARSGSAVPEVIDTHWFRAAAPVGLQLGPGFVTESPLRMGFVATRVQDDRPTGGEVVDLGYPFLLVEAAGRLCLQFSSLGPVAELRRDLAVAFGERLMWRARRR